MSKLLLVHPSLRCHALCLAALVPLLALPCAAQSNFTFRVMAANLPGDPQTYQAEQIRILQGLDPDVVAIQEFNYLGNSPADIRAFVDTALGTNFVYYRESGFQIPNGVISRWPIVNSGSWPDPEVANRGFAWAQVDLPGSNDLYVVSVHLLNSGTETQRNNEALSVRSRIATNFPADAWVIVAGDLNTGRRDEPAIGTFTTFLSDTPIPTDAIAGGNPNTNRGRNEPYDYVLPSFSLTNYLTNVVVGAQSFPKGLVFDSRVFTPLTSVPPVQFNDSDACQHMAVIKDFHVNLGSTQLPDTAPEITDQPDSLSVPQGGHATFAVSATGTAPLAYQWRFNGTDLAGATTSNYTRFNVQPADAGPYTVVITNVAGSVTSAPAVLTVLPPGTNTFSGVLAGWDVNGQTAFGISPMPPTTNAANVTVIGLTRGAGVMTSQTAANRAWGGNGFDAPSAAAAVISNDVATCGLTAQSGYMLSLTSISRFDYRRSSTGPPNGLLQYQVGSGAFADLTTLSYTTTSSDGASLPAIDLSGIPALQNIGAGTNVTFRIVNYGGSSGGTWYVFDVANSPAPDLAISGTLVPIPPPPPTPATLLNPASSAGQFQFDLTGQTGAVYVIESTTNLAGGVWTPVLTNTAPFLYQDTNAAASPLRLYRGRSY